MKVLGVSFGYHDSSASLVIDGKLVAAAAEERFTRQKHDANFPTYAIEYCLERAGLNTEELDQAVFHEDPHAKFSRVLCTALAPFPGSRSEFVNSTKAWLGKKLWSLNTLSSRLALPADKISYLSHHFSHAVQAFMGSGFEESAILVVDAVGDWACTALYQGRWSKGRPQVKRVLEIAFPNSLGLVYSAFTGHLGFVPNDSECSTMALAAFGKPVYADRIHEIVAAAEDGTYRVDQSYFNFDKFYSGAVTERFVQLFGPERDVHQSLPFNAFERANGVTGDQQRYVDLACSIQRVLEERILELCRKLHRETGMDRLCMAGGVALNCVANQRILQESPFRELYVPPDPGDGGTSIGCALYWEALHSENQPESITYDVYLGKEFEVQEDLEMLEHLDPDHFLAYMNEGVQRPKGCKIRHKVEPDQETLCAHVASLLSDGGIVGWFQGGFEIGPRALGNRSILIRPDRPELAMRLSKRVKQRAAYRPYAFSVAAEDALEILDVDPQHLRAYRWMQFAAAVREEAKEKVRAALHVDGTSRPQICWKEENPKYHALLSAFGEHFGKKVLLNTSFNPRGYPIVAAPVEAMAMFARTEMDFLVVNDAIVWMDQ